MTKHYCELCDCPVTPAKDGDCPLCGAGITVYRQGRDRHDDDGVEYADPRDFLAGRE
jgi:uncharacterized Zn finger protein (UPF0148 family)